MDLIPVSSTNVAAVGFENGRMQVRFHGGGLYEYANVTRAQFDELLTTPSKGAFVQRVLVRNPMHPCRRLDKKADAKVGR